MQHTQDLKIINIIFHGACSALTLNNVKIGECDSGCSIDETYAFDELCRSVSEALGVDAVNVDYTPIDSDWNWGEVLRFYSQQPEAISCSDSPLPEAISISTNNERYNLQGYFYSGDTYAGEYLASEIQLVERAIIDDVEKRKLPLNTENLKPIPFFGGYNKAKYLISHQYENESELRILEEC
ncbi:hypothetical protein [Photobacterium kishitanii]|uniref:Uncharacterized protein n=1 Tax=Photobacterium kishitanii TaxID=318456 RepID=A0A2T3KLH6_9GAMM|nr:hypothetical protein [Photobacterium kishitanii]PSV00500.1 hypothetical protein C9J27_05030 [Photobacterium kishitanii]